MDSNPPGLTSLSVSWRVTHTRGYVGCRAVSTVQKLSVEFGRERGSDSRRVKLRVTCLQSAARATVHTHRGLRLTFHNPYMPCPLPLAPHVRASAHAPSTSRQKSPMRKLRSDGALCLTRSRAVAALRIPNP